MIGFEPVLRYWHTIRHLRPGQVLWRLWFRVYRPRAFKAAPPSLRDALKVWHSCPRPQRQIGPQTFRFIGEEHTLDGPESWNNPGLPKLWLYNLHYFDDVVAQGSPSRSAWHRSLIERWIEENPLGRGTGWEPYPTSLRLVNWSKWLLAGNEPVPGMVASMATQTRWLRKRLELHLLGNHLWANLKALIFFGTMFEGSEANRIRASALRRFSRELDEQILPDGGHMERSPMYQAILLEDLLDLIQLDHVFPGVLPQEDVERWRREAASMLAWLQVMSHPDGEISFFNDAAFGIAPHPSDLGQHAEALGISSGTVLRSGVTHLSETGYLCLAEGPAVVLVDAAPVGPDYLPGHAHADTLSFELSLAGVRLLVNGGTSTYEVGARRSRERSTSAHNTLQVDDTDSSEVWGGFRVARRARPIEVVSREFSDENGPVLTVTAAHNGYERLRGKVTHHRSFTLRSSELVIEDRLTGVWQSAVARFRLAPGIRVVQEGPGFGRIVAEDSSLPEVQWRADGCEISVEEGTWAPEFGRHKEAEILTARLRTDVMTIRFAWGPHLTLDSIGP